MTAAAARARGLVTTVASAEALAAIDRASDREAFAAALARAQLRVAGPIDPDAIDRFVRDRIAADLAVLARWTHAVALLELDEDRHSLRAIVRGLAGDASPARRLAGAVPTTSLPASELATLASAPAIEAVAARLTRRGHPLAPALAGARMPVDVFALELALARRFAALARASDLALRTYLAQTIDAENAATALLAATRGAGLDVAHMYLPGGRWLARDAFLAAAAGPPDVARARLATALAGTPLAGALFEAAPAAFDDAVLAWQLETQARLRRLEPLGLAPVIYTVLRRRDEARRLRRAAWRVAMGAR